MCPAIFSLLRLDFIEAGLKIAARGCSRQLTGVSMSIRPAAKPRRGRPPKIDPAHILKVAREVFLARGIGATTLEVAERAGVSEGSIFYRFKSKQGLFREAMELSENAIPDLLMEALRSLKEEDLEDALHRLAQRLIDVARVALPLLMMSWSNPTPEDDCNGPNALKFKEFIDQLTAYFQSHMTAGRMRPMDAEIVARTFLGAVHHYCMSRMFSEEHGIEVMSERVFIRGHVDLLLRGIEFRAENKSSPYSRRLD